MKRFSKTFKAESKSKRFEQKVNCFGYPTQSAESKTKRFDEGFWKPIYCADSKMTRFEKTVKRSITNAVCRVKTEAPSRKAAAGWSSNVHCTAWSSNVEHEVENEAF